jgi:hypothetical protein
MHSVPQSEQNQTFAQLPYGSDEDHHSQKPLCGFINNLAGVHGWPSVQHRFVEKPSYFPPAAMYAVNTRTEYLPDSFS